jgi:hypothetical protein
LLGRTGQPFWQAESYDHVVGEENNPVKSRTGGQRGRVSLVERGKKSRDESRLDSLRHES